jgi:hypothetical protein
MQTLNDKIAAYKVNFELKNNHESPFYKWLTFNGFLTF